MQSPLSGVLVYNKWAIGLVTLHGDHRTGTVRGCEIGLGGCGSGAPYKQKSFDVFGALST